VAFLVAFAAVLGAAEARGQGLRRGRVVRETVHGKGLERNVTGENPDRAVSIYLPPGYDRDGRRYPVVFLLHGIIDDDQVWTHGKGAWSSIQDVMDRGIAEGRFGPMIVVMPDERTRMQGSYYTNSSATGRWEDFTVKELVAWVDRRHRTLTRPGGRGIAGHSMGGYGALKLGMKHPEVFAAAYGMNPAVLGWAREVTLDHPALLEVLRAKSHEDLVKPSPAEPYRGYKMAAVCVAQAFSPNPARPPFFVDFPFDLKRGRVTPNALLARWESSMPIYMVRRYRANLMLLRGYRFDSGYEDAFLHIPPTARQLSAELTALAVPHVFEEYNGDHRNRLWGPEGRLATEVFPWFGRLLDRR
jgi:enterochelin esterase-like enzyme